MKNFLLTMICFTLLTGPASAGPDLESKYLRIQDEIFSLVYDHGFDPEDARIRKLHDKAEEILVEKERIWQAPVKTSSNN